MPEKIINGVPIRVKDSPLGGTLTGPFGHAPGWDEMVPMTEEEIAAEDARPAQAYQDLLASHEAAKADYVIMPAITELAKDHEERRQRLLQITQAEVGKDRVGFGNDSKLVKEVVPIGVLDVDDILGGGLRKGRMAMIVGHESMGKTLFTQWIIRAFQGRGELCGFIDPEKTYEPKWFEQTGVNTADLLVVHPSNTEQTFDLACTWAESGMGLIVIDSLAALVPRSRIESDLDNQEFMGLAARKSSEGLAQFTNKNTEAMLVCTNQLRSKIGVVYGSTDSIPGGKAQMYYSSYIIKISRKGWIKDKDEKIGYHMGVEVLKNKLAPPFQTTTVPFMYTGVVDTVFGTLDLALDLGVVAGKKGFYDWNGQKYHGREKLMQVFNSDPAEFALLQELVKLGGGPDVDSE